METVSDLWEILYGDLRSGRPHFMILFLPDVKLPPRVVEKAKTDLKPVSCYKRFRNALTFARSGFRSQIGTARLVCDKTNALSKGLFVWGSFPKGKRHENIKAVSVYLGFSYLPHI